MVREIVKDPIFLQQKSDPATKEDAYVITDLCDTLTANRANCVGMAANMIGIKKQIIAIAIGPLIVPMVNPVITKKNGRYETKESCLSLKGERKCVRFKEIEVAYLDKDFNKKHGKYSGFVAQIILHEIQHFPGDLI